MIFCGLATPRRFSKLSKVRSCAHREAIGVAPGAHREADFGALLDAVRVAAEAPRLHDLLARVGRGEIVYYNWIALAIAVLPS